MKKLSIFLITLLSVTIIFSSCNKDDDTVGPPTLNFIGGEGYVDTDATIETGTFYKVGISATANAESGEKLYSLQFTRTNQDGISFVDTTFMINDNAYNIDFELNSQQAGTYETLGFQLIDNAAQIINKSLTITYEATGVAVTKHTGITMGSHNDDNGSFYSTTTNETYSITTATANQEKIDFLFYLGVTNGSSIASPADVDANTVYAINDWTTKNATLFAKTEMTVAEFDAIVDKCVFPEFTSTLSGITNLETNNILMFRTVNDELGYIKVNSINGRGDFISIDVIVTQ